jgi:septum formation protein
MKTDIILASGSLIRSQLLQNSGVVFHVKKHKIDEEEEKKTLIKNNIETKKISINLAIKKAMDVSKSYKNSFVIGCDQALVFNNAVFSKAKSPEELKQQLLLLKGKSHKLYSSCAVLYQEKIVWSYTAEIVLLMRDINQREVTTYVDKNWERVKNSVGGYLIESTGKRLFKTINGDYFSALGLPIIELLDFLILKKVVSIV